MRRVRVRVRHVTRDIRSQVSRHRRGNPPIGLQLDSIVVHSNHSDDRAISNRGATLVTLLVFDK